LIEEYTSYIISKTETEVVGIPDSLGNVCRLPHVAIAYRENPTDIACKWLHISMQDNDLYKSITLSGNVLTLTKTNGSVETITLPSVDSKGNDIESTYATKTELSNHTLLMLVIHIR
jgi:hypothetical protein